MSIFFLLLLCKCKYMYMATGCVWWTPLHTWIEMKKQKIVSLFFTIMLLRGLKLFHLIIIFPERHTYVYNPSMYILPKWKNIFSAQMMMILYLDWWRWSWVFAVSCRDVDDLHYYCGFSEHTTTPQCVHNIVPTLRVCPLYTNLGNFCYVGGTDWKNIIML